MEKILLIITLVAFVVREIWNAFSKKRLKKEVTKQRTKNIVAELNNIKEKTDASGKKYHDLRDRYGRFTKPKNSIPK